MSAPTGCTCAAHAWGPACPIHRTDNGGWCTQADRHHAGSCTAQAQPGIPPCRLCNGVVRDKR